MSESEPRVRQATCDDAKALGMLCRRGFQKSPEWRVPMVIVRRWWRGVIAHPGCFVRILEGDDGVIGFLIGVRDPEVWNALGKRGPHSKWMKILVMLTRPSYLKSYLQKRRRAHGAKGAPKNAGDANKGQSDGEKSVRYQRVSRSDVLGEGGGLYLAIMAIDPDARGRGAGKLIVEHFDELGSDLNVGTLWLHVDPRNERAQGLYSRFGYEVRGREGNSLLMSKGCGGGAEA